MDNELFISCNPKSVMFGQTDSNRLDSFCHEVTFDTTIFKKVPLSEIGKIVKINESKFGKRKYYHGHRVEGQWVFGGYERDTGNCFMVPVENRSAVILLAIIKEWIKPETVIISDCWKVSYKNV